jgi:hypothetical protein
MVCFSNPSKDNPIDLSRVKPGITKLAVKPFKGCCGSLLGFSEYTILDVGEYKDKSCTIPLFRVEGNLFFSPAQISYLITPDDSE